MIDIVSLYNELSVLNNSEQQQHLLELKKTAPEKACELEKMLKIDGSSLSCTEFISQHITRLQPISWQSFIGQQVMGFTIKSLLSDAGGMGFVFHAEQKLVCPNHKQIENHKAAIKILRSDKLSSEQQKAIFFSEASSLISLDHHNICSIYGVSEVINHACIVMDFIDGESLEHWLKNNKVTNKQKINIFIQLLNAVCYLHKLQTYHGDLKPQNIIINDQGHLVLIDLGLTNKFKQAHANENSDVVKAFSKNWSAPEQIAGEPCKGMSDVYSLGAIFHYLLSNQTLIDSDSRGSSRAPLNKDKELNAILMKALAMKPEVRYESANQFLSSIKRYQQRLPLDEYSTSSAYQLKKLVTRKPFTSLTCILMLYSIGSSVMIFLN